MLLDRAIRHVAPENVPKFVLIGAGDMRIRWLVVELDAVALGAAHNALLPIDRQSLPLGHLMLPLLEQQHRAGGATHPFGQQGCGRRVEQRRILGAIDESGEVAVVLVRPARRLLYE